MHRIYIFIGWDAETHSKETCKEKKGTRKHRLIIIIIVAIFNSIIANMHLPDNVQL